jgi:hypothetical protein
MEVWNFWTQCNNWLSSPDPTGAQISVKCWNVFINHRFHPIHNEHNKCQAGGSKSFLHWCIFYSVAGSLLPTHFTSKHITFCPCFQTIRHNVHQKRSCYAISILTFLLFYLMILSHLHRLCTAEWKLPLYSWMVNWEGTSQSRPGLRY